MHPLFATACAVLPLLLLLEHLRGLRSPRRRRVKLEGHAYYPVHTDDEAQDISAAIRLHVLRVMGGRVVRHAFGSTPARVRALRLEELASGGGEAAHVEDKRILRICLRQRGRFLDLSASRKVYLHELAHVASNTTGHGDEFQRALARLEASARTLRYPIDPPLAHFCGFEL